ncbi:iron-sulfur cluster co-chaperone protein HscB, mitochondrial [Cimex lectularius]|uniref:J domain-containing protein n=1 Tax=Cimex lectularius TaxID=79782 RepID=A0A8I6S4J6_CIMLE|nr:iron-sulfur cluster co-chaperone protein HscB, mitochondrial [Cimex lectularius]
MACKCVRIREIFRTLLYIKNLPYRLNKQNIFQTKINILNSTPPVPFYLKKYSSYKCWNCEFGSERFSLKCPNCQKIQNPDKRCNLFDVLDQQVVYDLDETELKRVYKNLQVEFHPDKYGQSSEKELFMAENLSSLINKAYFTLADPYERGMYILHLKNVDTSESDIELNRDFLMEVMERNEELEKLIGSQRLDEFDEEINKNITEISENISNAFKAKDFVMMKAELQRMKYYISIRNRIKNMKNKFSDI